MFLWFHGLCHDKLRGLRFAAVEPRLLVIANHNNVKNNGNLVTLNRGFLCRSREAARLSL